MTDCKEEEERKERKGRKEGGDSTNMFRIDK